MSYHFIPNIISFDTNIQYQVHYNYDDDDENVENNEYFDDAM